MKIIDDDCPDAERLGALKAAFYAVNRVTAGDAQTIVEYQLWQIAKELRSGDILLLRSIYSLVNRAPGSHYKEWVSEMARTSGLQIAELLERHEKRLVDLLLVTPRTIVPEDGQLGYDHSGFDGRNNRLSLLGFRFCKNLETYQADFGAAKESQQSRGSSRP